MGLLSTLAQMDQAGRQNMVEGVQGLFEAQRKQKLRGYVQGFMQKYGMKPTQENFTEFMKTSGAPMEVGTAIMQAIKMNRGAFPKSPLEQQIELGEKNPLLREKYPGLFGQQKAVNPFPKLGTTRTRDVKDKSGKWMTIKEEHVGLGQYREIGKSPKFKDETDFTPQQIETNYRSWVKAGQELSQGSDLQAIADILSVTQDGEEANKIAKSGDSEKLKDLIDSEIEYWGSRRTYKKSYENEKTIIPDVMKQSHSLGSNKKVVRTGTYNGRRVIEYSDGSIKYAD